MSSLDYLDLCRLCLVKDRVSVPIFESEGDARQIFLKITACLPVKVTREDKLPKKICEDCVYKVELLYQFWNTTANAEKQLLQWLGEVNMEDKQGYTVGTVLNPSGMKPEQSNENRLDGSVMSQVSGHQNNINMGIMDNMGVCMPMMMSNSNQQITSVPMDNTGSSVQNIQPVAGPSTQTTHDQITQNQTNASLQQEEEEESSEEEENSDDECDGDEGLPIKEESEEDPNNSRTIEPTTFVNVSLACDEAGPSGLQQQKIADMPEMVMPQAADVDPKTGAIDPLNVECNTVQKLFARIECEWTKTENSLAEHEDRILDEVNIASMRRESSPRFTVEKNQSIKKKTACVECDYCRRKFLKKSNLAEHLKQHRHKCADCPKTFSLRRYLVSHIEKNHQQQMYECSVCEYKSNNKGTLKSHYIRLHTSSYDYSCDTCGKQFKMKKVLNHHVKQKHGSAPPIVCDVCGHFSKNLHALKAHMKYKHYKPEFVCRICRRGMTTQENLEQHLTWHETREKVLCPTCGKRFRGRDLDTHMRVHTGVKPFPCPVCGKTFRRQNAQQQHVLIHTGKRPYICDICGQAFSQKPGLICHRKRHPGPLPPLPVVSIKNIVTEFTKEYATKNGVIKIE